MIFIYRLGRALPGLPTAGNIEAHVLLALRERDPGPIDVLHGVRKANRASRETCALTGLARYGVHGELLNWPKRGGSPWTKH
jgi:hypothetical protein